MKILVACAQVFLGIIYFFMKLCPVEDKVVMISRQANRPSLDFTLIRRHLLKQAPQIKIVTLCHTLEKRLNAKYIDLIKYGFHMLKQMYHIATSKVVVLDTYCIVVSLLKHRKNLQIIQIWHSMGSMKKFGYTALDTPEGVPSKTARLLHMHENYTCVLASSPAYSHDLARGFNCDDSIVRIMPLPRTDLLRSAKYKKKKRSEIYKKFPELEGRRVILYCPTFRKDEEKMRAAIENLTLFLDKTKDILVFMPHPLSKISISGPGILCAPNFSSFDMLFVADAVISDYSCIVYEAAFIGLPVYFYNFDMSRYLQERGLAIDYYKEIPGPSSNDPQVVMDAIHSGIYDWDRLKAFSDKYICYSGHAGQDIARYILSFL